MKALWYWRWNSAVIILMVCLGCMGSLAAQESAEEPPAETETQPEPEAPRLTPDQEVLEMDIKTSTLSELAGWCRQLGLSEGGTKDELANRLRAYYELPPPVSPGTTGEKQRIITIESARTTEYFTLEAVDEEYARLQGEVIISLKDGEAVHRIKAGEILYNRTRNIMTASRGVEYIKEGGDTVETFKGESITVNLDNWSSLFLDGLTERSSGSGDETTYRFAGNVISRSDEEATVLSNATVTNAKNEESYWSLKAHKLWLLPGSDWAVLSAVLKVGEIPVFYFPFFYFAADEVIFHPVIGPTIGHNSRGGNFLQTTTYILGRPKIAAGSQNSLSKIMGNGANSEKVQEGIFLRSTGKKIIDPQDTRLSVLFDAYSNLGVYFGTQLGLPPKGVLSAIDLSAGIGFTRDVYLVNSSYTPFAQYSGSDNWNTAPLFGIEVPFRYRFTTQGSLSGTYGTMSWTFPFYSDPYTERDFLNRSEEMDWIKLFKNDDPLTASENLIGEHQWRITSSLTLPLSKFNVDPYISSVSLSNTSSVNFRSRQSGVITNGVSPNRLFFFPEKFTIYSINASISGTPFTFPFSPSPGAPQESGEDPFHGIGIPRSPWGTPTETEGSSQGAAAADTLNPPVLKQEFTVRLNRGPQFSINYQFNPSSATELRFRSSQQNWSEAADINWSEVSSVFTTIKEESSVRFSLSQPETELYKTSFQLSTSAQWQGLTYINNEAEEYTANGNPDQTKIDNARLIDYKATWFRTSYNLSTGFKPLYQYKLWENLLFQYTLGGQLIKNEFNGTAQDPSWQMKWGEWIKEDLSAHQLSASFSTLIRDYSQSLTINTDLPPKDAAIGANATIRAWISQTNIQHSILNPWEHEKRKFQPLTITETITFGPGTKPFRFEQSLAIDPELGEFTNLLSSLSWSGISASFSAVRSLTYTLESNGWVQSKDPEKLNPRQFQLGYTGSFKKDALWNKRLSLSFDLRSNLSLDLQRYTNSNFTFSLGFTLAVTRLLNFSVSASSENKVLFRYFQSLFDLPIEIPGEQNIFIDLLNSFRFDDESLRRSSGFKLKTLGLAFTHHLGDWDAKLGITLSPYLDQTSRPYRYKFNPEISFLVQWIPITEIKTEIASNKDKIVIK
ncbi:MAG: LPS-assembly protein LptD [Treponema sp.]|jgi:lipopolysaccharide assembly outer membrane protein LptD (OstA)|nr:LPS-assembly protein LptD [Treponema sp.]